MLLHSYNAEWKERRDLLSTLKWSMSAILWLMRCTATCKNMFYPPNNHTIVNYKTDIEYRIHKLHGNQ